MVEHTCEKLGVRKKCELLGVNRSRIYYKKKSVTNQDVKIMNEMRNIFLKFPFYGYRRMQVILTRKGYGVNHKKVQRLMALAGLQAVFPKKKTAIRNKRHRTYPFLLAEKNISQPNIAWGTDITYIKIQHGFVYLVCIIDIFSRRIMGWCISVSLDTKFCIDALENALSIAKPEVVNSDQGCQFTSYEWIQKLTMEEIEISMDGKGRWADNIHIERFWRSLKYENVFLHSFDTVAQAKDAIVEYIKFYNYERPHQALDYKTPDSVYKQQKRKVIKHENIKNNLIHKHKNNVSQIVDHFWY